ncbi:hypothetical protein LNN38_15830 [Pseudomonas sp. LA21]|uniref:hypothetical protein n=1 Tax=unclassified Pseudomonas TaxID=196821 RepID=UPI001FB7178F|nr:hypothetical protein [Pseudomonas sp. LA21]MCJ1886327.1 hypothetical protein [Pseudomonas sp. LA21]
MQESPFIPPRAGLRAETEYPVPALWQPYLAVAVLFLLGIGAQVLGRLWQWHSGVPVERLLQTLPGQLGAWLSSLAVSGALVVLFMQAQRERHGILRFRPLAVIAVAFFALQMVADQLYSKILVQPIQEFAFWLGDLSDQSFLVIPVALIGGVLVQLALYLICLWMVLAATRSRSERQTSEALPPIRRMHVALGVALAFAGLTAKLLSGLVRLFVLNRMGYWGTALEVLAWMLPAALVLLCVYARLPNRLQRYGAGRVLLAGLTVGLGWLLCTALFGALGYVLFHDALMRMQTSAGLPLVASISILGPLLLLAGSTCLGARWLPGRQSSPR